MNTAWPEAAPGDAGNPFVVAPSAFQAFGSKTGASSCETDSGSTCSTASLGVISFWFTRSVAIITAA